MKILYVGLLDPFGTCFSRLTSLRELADDVHTFDVDRELDWSTISKFQRQVEQHLSTGPLIRRANAALLARARELRPDLVWVDKGDWVQRATLRALAAQGCFLVSHNTDAMVPHDRRVHLRRRLLRATAPDYDIFFTTNVDDQQAFVARGISGALLTDLGHDHRRFEPSPLSPELAARWDQDLLFIGHREEHTEAGVLALLDAGLSVRVYGFESWFASPNRARLGDRLQPTLGNEEYVQAIKGTRIGLCFVSRLNYNQTASRSFEITACGTFLLAMRTPQHLDCYVEGEEAEFFGDHEELVRKARYYLEHPEEREAIARRGRERNERTGYSWDAIMQRDWPRVVERYEQKRAGDAGVRRSA